MSSDTGIQQDLAFARALAEEGRTAPLLGGAHLATFGTLTAAAFAAHWAILNGLLFNGHGPAFAALWLGYGAAMGVAGLALGRRIAGKPGAASVSNRVEAAVWNAMGAGLGAIAIGAIAHMIITADIQAPNLIPPAALALYGAAWIATASFTSAAGLKGFGYAALAAAVGLGAFADAPWMYLAAAVAVGVVLILPGLMLLAREPKGAA